MSQIFHIIRSCFSINLYKEIIQESLHSGYGDEFFLSSGFYQINTNYNVATDSNSKLKNYLNNPHSSSITANIRSGYNSNVGKQATAFYQLLNSSNYKSVNLSYRNRTHAKIFLLQEKGIPILEIIGSSNHTRPAYGTTSPFNKEADLVICNHDKLCELVSKIIFSDDDLKKRPNGIMQLDYSKEKNGNNSLENQMIWIRDNFF